LCKACAHAEQLEEHNRLAWLFDQLESCEFPISAARMYYESKALEALAVLSADCEASVFAESPVSDMNVDDDFTSRARRYIEDNSHAELTIELLARIACMSSSKLKYSFRRSFDKSVSEYITEIRMEKAKRLLADTCLPIEGVATEVGYKKSGAFAAAFRRYSGSLPKEYRNGARTKFDLR
jgi:AraC-like DNA-binding protein